MNEFAVVVFVLYVIVMLSLRYFKITSEKYKYMIRKSVHLATGLMIFFLTFHVDRLCMLILISGGTVFSLITYIFSKLNFLHKTSGSSLGTIFYPIGLLTSFILLYNMPVYYFQISLMILSVSDTLANFSGEITKRNKRFAVFNEEKSLLGVACFAGSAYLLHLILLPQTFTGYFIYIMLSVIAAVNFELISYRGSDNFTIPVGCALFFLLTYNNQPNSLRLTVFIPLLAAGTVMLYTKNILTKHGSIGAYILGVYLITLSGIAWITPVIIFFITSVMLTKLNGFVNRKTDDSGRRNIWQVCANILFAVISSVCYLITGHEIFIYFYITLLATVTGDTWASEIGPTFSKRCFSLSDFSFKASGTSGGLSLPGTIAAAAGSIMISILSCYLFFNKIDTNLITVISLAGFAAVFADSLFSSFLEPRLLNIKFFRDSTGPDSPTPNDIVNLSASLTAPLFFLLFRMMI